MAFVQPPAPAFHDSGLDLPRVEGDPLNTPEHILGRRIYGIGNLLAFLLSGIGAIRLAARAGEAVPPHMLIAQVIVILLLSLTLLPVTLGKRWGAIFCIVFYGMFSMALVGLAVVMNIFSSYLRSFGIQLPAYFTYVLLLAVFPSLGAIGFLLVGRPGRIRLALGGLCLIIQLGLVSVYNTTDVFRIRLTNPIIDYPPAQLGSPETGYTIVKPGGWAGFKREHIRTLPFVAGLDLPIQDYFLNNAQTILVGMLVLEPTAAVPAALQLEGIRGEAGRGSGTRRPIGQRETHLLRNFRFSQDRYGVPGESDIISATRMLLLSTDLAGGRILVVVVLGDRMAFGSGSELEAAMIRARDDFLGEIRMLSEEDYRTGGS